MTSPPILSQEDYEAIESAVVETARGRWFLAEYARRNRQADTTMLLTALDRIEAVVRGERSAPSIDNVRFDLVDMAKAIARTKAEIASIKPDTEQHGKFGEATEELDSIVQATETATSDILAAAEQIQEIAWTLREQGVDSAVCDLVDSKATNVYTACSFQDLTGQRTRKVINVLRYLEGRINAMIGIWGLDGAMAAESAEHERTQTGEKALLNGPALPGQGLDQADVDMVMGPAESSGASATVLAPAAPSPQRVAEAPAAQAVAIMEPAPARPAPEPLAALPSVASPRTGLGPMAQAMIAPSDPLAAVNALSYEEKVALFS